MNLFEFETEAAKAMAKSQQENEDDFSKDDYNKSIADRNWNWAAADFKYSPTRSQTPGAIGSYVVDALAMSLHLTNSSKSYKEAILRVVNMGGDADTVGAITGMIAGAKFGFEKEMRELYEQVRKWDGDKVAVRALKLFNKKCL